MIMSICSAIIVVHVADLNAAVVGSFPAESSALHSFPGFFLNFLPHLRMAPVKLGKFGASPPPTCLHVSYLKDSHQARLPVSQRLTQVSWAELLRPLFSPIGKLYLLAGMLHESNGCAHSWDGGVRCMDVLIFKTLSLDICKVAWHVKDEPQ